MIDFSVREWLILTDPKKHLFIGTWQVNLNWPGKDWFIGPKRIGPLMVIYCLYVKDSRYVITHLIGANSLTEGRVASHWIGYWQVNLNWPEKHLFIDTSRLLLSSLKSIDLSTPQCVPMGLS